LQMETTAEGVESLEQQAELQSRGCDTLQGFLFSRPVDAKAAGELIEQCYQQGRCRAA